MRLIDASFDEPALNLALDEVLLDSAESDTMPGTLRFWESPVAFVVLGTGQVLGDEVHETRCASDGVPVLRRCSAGGCVLQGPGCLNYVLALNVARFPEVASLHESYRFILGRLVNAFAVRGIAFTMEGISDLAVGGRKVSGSAQRRRRKAILHHGTLLYRPNLDGMHRYLREPEMRPAYRGTRTHAEFITSIPMSPAALREVVRTAFPGDNGPQDPSPDELDRCRGLVHSKYGLASWNYRR